MRDPFYVFIDRLHALLSVLVLVWVAILYAIGISASTPIGQIVSPLLKSLPFTPSRASGQHAALIGMYYLGWGLVAIIPSFMIITLCFWTRIESISGPMRLVTFVLGLVLGLALYVFDLGHPL